MVPIRSFRLVAGIAVGALLLSANARVATTRTVYFSALDDKGVAIADLLTGGEDYQVLATVAPERAADFERIGGQSGIGLAQLGVIAPASAGIAAVDAAGKPLVFAKLGWDHFSQP